MFVKYFTSSKIDNKNRQVVVLKSNNYATWKIQIKMQLIALELFNIVDGVALRYIPYFIYRYKHIFIYINAY